MTVNLSQLFNFKRRNAEKLAKARIEETEHLMRRAGEQISEGQQELIRRHIDTTRNAITNPDLQALKTASDALDATAESVLGSYRRPVWRDTADSILIAVLVALFLRWVAIEAFKIPSGSMIPTLAVGDQIFVNKFIYGIRIPFTSYRLIEFSTPERGDVIVFRFPNDPRDDYIKRVVAIPGDRIEVRNSMVYVNGVPNQRAPLGRQIYTDRDGNSGRWYKYHANAHLESTDDKTYTVLRDPKVSAKARDYGPQTIPPGHVFVMGDNRDHSHDSRGWGMLPIENILGRAMFVWWSWNNEGLNKPRLGTWIE